MITDDPQRHPVEGLARLLLQHAREDPTLLARSQIGAVSSGWPAPRPVQRPANDTPLRLAASAPDQRELEQLVSLAVACARRAEDACRQAQETGWMARRRMSAAAAIASVAALAVAGGAGSVMLHHTDRQAELDAVASAVREVRDTQQRTTSQLSGIGLDLAALRDSARTRPVSSAPAESDAQDRRATQAAEDTEPAVPEPGSTSALTQAPPLPPAIFVRAHPYPPPQPALHLPADALRQADMLQPTLVSRRPPPRRARSISSIPTFLTGIFTHR